MKIAALCFLPDRGHVIALLRVCGALKSGGHEVVCFLPEESVECAEQVDVPVVSIGAVHSVALAEAKAGFRLTSDVVSEVAYRRAITFAAERLRHGVQNMLEEVHPDALLVDNHWRRYLPYEALASRLRVPMFANVSNGSLVNAQDPFRYHHGPSSLPLVVREVAIWLEFFAIPRIVGMPRRVLGWISGAGFRQARFAEEPQSSPLPTSVSEEGREYSVPTYVLCAGLGAIEAECFRGQLAVPDDFRLFGPIIGTDSSARDLGQIGEWLKQMALSGRTVVYVSFGTMGQVSPERAQMILCALETLGLAAVWALPNANEALRSLRVPEHVRVEEWVSQRDVVASSSVKCAVGHGGAGIVRDCLVSGKPLLCIPLMWDQFYNSAVVDKLRVGRKVTWAGLTQRRLVAALCDITSNQAYYDAAKALRVRIEHLDGGRSLAAFISGVCEKRCSEVAVGRLPERR